nr:TetR family transcriptional regulator [Streptomyces sp. NRRL WC-3742]
MPENDHATPALTRDALAQAALRVLERGGLTGRSMRKIAAEVGVKAASPYWHVRNKEELLDLLNDAVLAKAAPRPARAAGANNSPSAATATAGCSSTTATPPRSSPVGSSRARACST